MKTCKCDNFYKALELEFIHKEEDANRCLLYSYCIKNKDGQTMPITHCPFCGKERKPA